MGVVFEAKEEEERVGLLEDFIDRAGGCAVIDGGFATQLELHGASVNDPLWSALCLINNPHLISKVHLEYLEAGADIIVTSSYQATLPGFMSRGLTLEQGEKLLEKSVKLATEARDVFWETVEKIRDHTYNQALVAASIGSYGAYLADGSEYSGCYGPNVDLNKLKDFHRRRMQVLVEAGPDLLAFETIPNKLEAQVVAELLEEENVQIPSWICFSSVDGVNAPSGESFMECLEVLNKSKRIAAVGINCAPPQFVHSLVQKFKELTGKVIVVYPNSGETWDGVAKRWLVRYLILEIDVFEANYVFVLMMVFDAKPSKCFNDDKFKDFAIKWRDAGAKLIGGCCRTTPSTTRGLSKVLKQS